MSTRNEIVSPPRIESDPFPGTHFLHYSQLAECRVVFTEDMQHCQLIDERLKIINPFSER